MANINFYRHPLSGHAHRVEVLLSVLKVNAQLIDVDLLAGEHKQAAFLTKNPLGQVPVIEDEGHYISDSNAILVYLASKYDPSRQWLPEDPLQAAEVQKYLSLAAGPLAYGPATARLITVFGFKLDAESTIKLAHEALQKFEVLLEGKAWLVGEQATIADLASYAYIKMAPEGNVSLDPYSNINHWLQRVEQIEGFIPMKLTSVGLLA